MMGKLFEVQRHIEETALLNVKSVWILCTSQHNIAMYKANLNFNNNMSMAKNILGY
jgi:hypothetical protein